MIHPVSTLKIAQQNFKFVMVAQHFKILPCFPLIGHLAAGE
jgi:hypothetical protein